MQDVWKTLAVVREVYKRIRISRFAVAHQELDISQTTTWRILGLELLLYPYEIQLDQELKVNDHRHRHIFTEWVREQLATDPIHYRKIIFSDVVYFWMTPYRDKQSCPIWDDTNPHEIQ